MAHITLSVQMSVRTAEINRLRVLARHAGIVSPYRQSKWIETRMTYKGYHVGDVVAVKGQSQGRAVLRSFMPSVADGAVQVDRELDGCTSWNIDGLRRVTPWPK